MGWWLVRLRPAWRNSCNLQPPTLRKRELEDDGKDRRGTGSSFGFSGVQKSPGGFSVPEIDVGGVRNGPTELTFASSLSPIASRVSSPNTEEKSKKSEKRSFSHICSPPKSI